MSSFALSLSFAKRFFTRPTVETFPPHVRVHPPSIQNICGLSHRTDSTRLPQVSMSMALFRTTESSMAIIAFLIAAYGLLRCSGRASKWNLEDDPGENPPTAASFAPPLLALMTPCHGHSILVNILDPMTGHVRLQLWGPHPYDVRRLHRYSQRQALG